MVIEICVGEVRRQLYSSHRLTDQAHEGYVSEMWDGYDCLCLSVDFLIPCVGPRGSGILNPGSWQPVMSPSVLVNFYWPSHRSLPKFVPGLRGTSVPHSTFRCFEPILNTPLPE